MSSHPKTNRDQAIEKINYEGQAKFGSKEARKSPSAKAQGKVLKSRFERPSMKSTELKP